MRANKEEEEEEEEEEGGEGGERGKEREGEIETPGLPACPYPFDVASDSNRRECAHCCWGGGALGPLCGPLFVYNLV